MIAVEPQGDATRLEIRRPPENLLNPETMRELTAALSGADDDPRVRAIVLSGAGNVFCGGVDMEELKGGDPAEFATELVALLRVFPRLGKPVIGAVNGDALMSGFSLVVVTDIAVAVKGARLGTIEASLGLWPMIAQVPPLQRLLPRHALENVLSGEPFSAERALEVGAVNAVVESDQLENEVSARVALATRAKPENLAAGRRAFYRFLDRSYDEALDGGLDEFQRMLR